MDSEQLKAERIKNLIDATSFKEPDRIPVGIEMLTWPFAYAGVKYSDILDDEDKVYENYIKFTEVLDVDFIFGGFVTVPIRAYEAMGNKNFAIGDDGICFVHLQPNIEYMKTEE